jgi:aromatic ring-opening dioxygenase catalytic subunit (LigB family)
MLQAEGFNAGPNANFEWIHDTFMVLIKMFPDFKKCPPVTIISMNARYDPLYHVKVGATLRPLRKEGYLFIGTGGAVHNLYRNSWTNMVLYRESLGQESPPESWALDFRQATEDVVTKNHGPALRRSMVRLMQHPAYREAQATDDHWMPALFAAGAAGDWEDQGPNVLAAETWELVNMCNSQFTLGTWKTNAGDKAIPEESEKVPHPRMVSAAA